MARAALKPLKTKLTRGGRLLRYGDAEAVSFFDKKTPEIVIWKWPLRIPAAMRTMCVRLARECVSTYTKIMRETRVLIPDVLKSPYRGRYAKFCIAASWKNAFCLLEEREGWIDVSIDESTLGIYLFIGKQLLSRARGTLSVYLRAETEKRILARKLTSLHRNWEFFYYALTDDEKAGAPGTVRLRWSVNRGGSGLLVSPPIVRRSKPSRKAIVIIADAVRPQDLGIYSGAPHTPNIDRFFSGSAVFENSFSQSNWTLPAFASIAMSRYASEHKVVDPDIYSRAMDRSVPTLAEMIRNSGFYTYGSVSHRRCNQSLGHHRGFDHFSYGQTLRGKVGTPGVRGDNDMRLQLREACDYIRNFRHLDFFGFIHLFDTHFPYLYSPGRLNAGNLLFEDAAASFVQKSFQGSLRDKEYDFITNEYFEKLSELDYLLGELFSLLSDMENVTVFFTSDHGYSFRHPLGDNLSDEEIHTPFLVRSNEFSLPPGRHQRFVESSIDLLPTMTELFSIDDRAARSGTKIFDNFGRVATKEWAISEILYHETYVVKIVGMGNCSLLFESAVERSNQWINADRLRIADVRTGTKDSIEFKEFMLNAVKTMKVRPEIRDKCRRLIMDLEVEGG